MTGQMERRIRERWDELRPMLVIYYRRESVDPTLRLVQLQELHSARVERLLKVGVRLRKIRKWNWDDPLRGDREFDECFRMAVANLKKRNRRPPVGLAKFTQNHVPSNRTRTTQGDKDADRT